MDVFGLILAGGSGTRLWPLSRKNSPKQCLSLGESDQSLIQQTYSRLKHQVPAKNIWTITNKVQYYTIQKQLSSLSDTVAYNNVLLEPLGKNTAPAILWSALVFNEISEDSVMVVLPSDHLIADINQFNHVLNNAIEIAKEGKLVTFGIQPNEPETGYGYIKMGSPYKNESFSVEKFVEKPDVETAKSYLNSGNFLWNSGMFVFPVKQLLKHFEELTPELWKVFVDNKTAANKWLDHDFINQAFEKAESISIDYAILEKAKEVIVIPCELGWSDLGSWLSVFEKNEKDQDKNVIKGNSITIDSSNTLIFSQKDKITATIGIKDLIIVDTEDALLVCHKSKAQEVKQVCSILKDRNLNNLL